MFYDPIHAPSSPRLALYLEFSREKPLTAKYWKCPHKATHRDVPERAINLSYCPLPNITARKLARFRIRPSWELLRQCFLVVCPRARDRKEHEHQSLCGTSINTVQKAVFIDLLGDPGLTVSISPGIASATIPVVASIHDVLVYPIWSN